jgi:Putative transposase
MTHRPHVHMIVPGGGISLDGSRWVSCRYRPRVRSLAAFGPATVYVAPSIMAGIRSPAHKRRKSGHSDIDAKVRQVGIYTGSGAKPANDREPDAA